MFLHLAAPASLQPDPVEVHIGVVTLDAPVTPGVDLKVYLLIQLATHPFLLSRAMQKTVKTCGK